MNEEDKAIFKFLSHFQAFRETFCKNLTNCSKCKLKPRDKAICGLIDIEMMLHKGLEIKYEEILD